MSGFRMTPRKQLSTKQHWRAHYEENTPKSWRSPTVVWGTFCNTWNNLAQCKTIKGKEDPEEPPQGKTSTWNWSACTREENQVSGWQIIKWEQAWILTSRPALSAESLRQQISMAELQQRNHCWERRTRWKDWNVQGNTKIWWLNNGRGVFCFDESKFELFGLKRCQFVCRRAGERYDK